MICTAELDPIQLFYVTEEERKTSIADEIFAWDRTVSCNGMQPFCLSLPILDLGQSAELLSQTPRLAD